MAYKKIQFKRGTKTGMPVLRSGEPGFTQDEKSLYIGDGTANQRFLNEVQVGTKIDEKIAPVTQSITNNVAALNESIASNITTVNQAITDKAKINGEATNVNFIRNEIVKDGLVGSLGYTVKSVDTLIKLPIDTNLKKFTIIIDASFNKVDNIIDFVSLSNAYNLYNYLGKYTIVNPENHTYCPIAFEHSKIVISVDNGKITFIKNDFINTSVTNIIDTTISYVNLFRNTTGIINGVVVYNRSLTSQEINHNFNVLSNSQSINKINDYVIASDTDHVTDSGSILQSKINRVFYKDKCEEFTSDGSAISVNNGMDGYLLSATLQGQTVKVISSDGTKRITLGGTNTRSTSYNIGRTLEVGKQYYITTICNSQNGNPEIWFGGFSPSIVKSTSLGANKNIITFTVVASSTSVAVAISQNDFDAGKTFDGYIVISDNGFVENPLPFGLSSTQATIFNNGLKYSFYLNNEDKLNNRVIDLGGFSGVYNTLIINEDRSATSNNMFGKINIDSSCVWNNNGITTDKVMILVLVSDGMAGGVTLSDRIPLRGTISTSKYIYIDVLKNTLGDLTGLTDVEIFAKAKEYCISLNSYVKYQLATPIVTPIDKSLVPAILTQATNTFQFGEAVAPYSVTIKAPVTDGITKSYTVSLLNAYTQTPSTATPIVNLLNTGIVRLQMDLTAPSTGMNATIFTLPTELRPITNARIPVFVNGVSQLATIDKTTGNVNLASVPSASANVYIKTDYRRDI